MFFDTEYEGGQGRAPHRAKPHAPAPPHLPARPRALEGDEQRQGRGRDEVGQAQGHPRPVHGMPHLPGHHGHPGGVELVCHHAADEGMPSESREPSMRSSTTAWCRIRNSQSNEGFADPRVHLTYTWHGPGTPATSHTAPKLAHTETER